MPDAATRLLTAMLSLRTRAFALLTSWRGLVYFSKLCGVGVDGVRQLVRLVGDAGGVEVEAGASRPPPLPPEPPELLWLPPSLDTMAAMATPRATAAAATTRPAGMPKRVEVRAALMAASIPFDGCADGADHAGEARIYGREHTQEAAGEAGADGLWPQRPAGP